MALADYTDLKAAVGEWMARTDVLGNAEDFIALGEARLNRELNPVEVDATLTGSTGARTIDITSLACELPLSLFIAMPGINEAELTPVAPGTVPLISPSGRPRFWWREGQTIAFERDLDIDYPFRFHFTQYFRLSDGAPTNWLMTNHPDVYLAASLVWGGLFIRDNTYAAQFQAVLNSGIPEVRNIIARSKRGNLTVDPLLQRIGQPLRGTYNAASVEWP